MTADTKGKLVRTLTCANYDQIQKDAKFFQPGGTIEQQDIISVDKKFGASLIHFSNEQTDQEKEEETSIPKKSCCPFM